MAMKKDPSIAEASVSGFDCSVFSLVGSSSPAYAVCDVAHDEARLGYPIARDNLSPDLGARAQVPPALRDLRFRVERSGRVRTKSAKLSADILKIARGSVVPQANLAGICNLVSQRFRDAIGDAVANCCEFVPTELVGSEQRWYVLWVNSIEDAVDELRSDLQVLSWRDNGDELLNPRRLVFKRREAAAPMLFRLSQWRYFLEGDLCSMAFVDLLQQRGLRGAEWISAGGTGPFVSI